MKSLNKVTIKQLNNLTIAAILTFSSCKKDDPKKPVVTNPQEVLTTVLINGYNLNDSSNLNYQFNYKWRFQRWKYWFYEQLSFLSRRCYTTICL
jgi:hypothetical protein